MNKCKIDWKDFDYSQVAIKQSQIDFLNRHNILIEQTKEFLQRQALRKIYT